MKSSCLLTLILTLSSYQANAQQNVKLDSASYFYENYLFNAAVNYITEKNKQETYAQKILAKSYIQLGMQEAAIDVYNNLIELEPENITHKVELAQLYLKLNVLNEALSIFNELIELDFENPYYWRKVAFIHQKSSSVFEAIQAYQHTLTLNPNDQESGLQYTELLLKINQFQLADSVANHFLKKTYSNKVSFLKLKLKSAYIQKNYASVVSTANQLFLLKDSAMSTIKLVGIAEYRLGNYKESIQLLSSLLNENIDTEQIHFYLGAAYRSANEHQMATEQFDAAIQAGISENISVYYTQLAANYQEMGEYNKAIEAYKIAYESSQEKLLLYHIARAYDLYYKDKKVAINYYEKYLSFNDSSNRDYFHYSRSRVKQLKADRHFEINTSN